MDGEKKEIIGIISRLLYEEGLLDAVALQKISEYLTDACENAPVAVYGEN